MWAENVENCNRLRVTLIFKPFFYSPLSFFSNVNLRRTRLLPELNLRVSGVCDLMIITEVKYLTCSKCEQDYTITYDQNGITNNWWLQAYKVCNRCFNDHYFGDWKEKVKTGDWGTGPKPIEVEFPKEKKILKKMNLS